MKHNKLIKSMEKLLRAAVRFHNLRDKVLGRKEVVYVKASDGYLVVVCRGRYKQTVLESVENLSKELLVRDLTG